MKTDYNARYAVCGGLASIAYEYEFVGLSLMEIGNRVGFSRQTVWNDIRRHLGRAPVMYVASKAGPVRGRATFQELLAEIRQANPDVPAYTPAVICLCERIAKFENAVRISTWRLGTILHFEKTDGSFSQARIVRRGRLDSYTRLKVGSHCSIYQNIHFIIYGADDAFCVSIPGRNLTKIRTLALPSSSARAHKTAARFEGIVFDANQAIIAKSSGVGMAHNCQNL